MYNLIKDLMMIIILILYRQEILRHIKSVAKLLWVSSCFTPHSIKYPKEYMDPCKHRQEKSKTLLTGTGISCCSRNSLLMLVISSAMFPVIDLHK